MSETSRDSQLKESEARRALSFLIAKFAVFGVVPVAVAALIVYFTFPG